MAFRHRPSSTSSNKSINSTSSTHEHRRLKRSSDRKISYARYLFLSCLVAVATLLGFVAYLFLHQAETRLAEAQFDSIADRALTNAVVIAQQKRWSAITMASFVGQLLPDAEKWPFVTVPNFEIIVNNLLNTSSNEDMGFVPFVKPEQQEEWEDFIYRFYSQDRKPEPFPPGTAMSSFGKGIWATNPALDTADKRYHDFGNFTSYGSPNQILTPVTHVDEGRDRVLLFNLHSEPNRGKALDNILACSQARDIKIASAIDCGAITDMLIFRKSPTRGPSALIFTPIYPGNNQSEVSISSEEGCGEAVQSLY